MKLADVGILEVVEKIALQPQVQGKVEDIRWTAPDVLDGRPRGTSSDIYALGCLAFCEPARLRYRFQVIFKPAS